MHDPLSVEILERARRGDPVALCRAMVTTDSVNPVLAPGGRGERALAELVAGWLDAWGLNPEMIEVAPGRFNVVGKLEGEGPTLLLNGHLDTVGVEGMTIPPFAATLEGDRLLGRGSCDMKGGDAAILAAAARLAEGGPRPRLVVAFTADEEHASLGMAHLVESGIHADLAVVCEPTSLAVMPAHKGFVWLRALFRGRAAHGSRPEIGIDAIRHAGLYLAALDGYSEELRTRPAHALLEYGSFHAGTIEGGTAESVYPESCVLSLERRTMPGEEPEAVVLEFQAVLDALLERHTDMDASLEMTLARPGTEVPESSELVQGLVAAARARGVESGVEGMSAWVDAAFLNEARVPTVCFGPGDIAQAHTEDEWIDVREIRTCAEVLETFARGLAV
ncbi:MAG: M20/M25/M40 family metallo-hydrolase [Gemmatimonadetes bacterium]|nr:M20/M25/M40 family metallo-hydrolase [Gemmatimonadota bacterium]